MINKKKKEKKYEQLSLFELLSEEQSGMERDNSKDTKANKFSSVWGIENEKQTGSFSGKISGRNINNQQEFSEGGIIKNTIEEGLHSSGESKLYRKYRDVDGRTSDGMVNQTATISVPQDSIYHLNSQIESKLSVKQKYTNNISAIQLLKKITHENRRASNDEKDILAKYTGWGGCSQVFDENNDKWLNERQKLKNMISIEEYNNARASTLTSFYTPFSIIDNIYKIVDRLGFKKGRILETSCGTGNFFGRMPDEMMENSFTVGIELDTITGNIAKNIYDNCDIYIKGYEDVKFANGSFDLAISNIPFGNYKVFDKEYNKENFNIHNYFIAKSLSMIRNGGIIAFITTTETLDGNSEIRNFINNRAEFLGAIRLPSNVFMQNGGNTHVPADIIFLQRNDERKIETFKAEFLETGYHENAAHKKINEYFIKHPEMILGNITERTNQYGTYEIVVNEYDEFKDLDNHEKYNKLFDNILNSFTEVYEEIEIIDENNIVNNIELEQYRSNTYFIKDEHIYYKDFNSVTKVSLNDKATNRLIGQIKIAEATEKVINDQVNEINEEIYIKDLNKLNTLYDEFIMEFGYLFNQQNARVFKDDIRHPLLKSLEIIDPITKTAKKEKIFYEKTIKPKLEIKSVESISEGINVSLNMKGKIDLDYISSIYNHPTDIIKEEIIEKELAYIDPISKELIPANKYLSGNIRKKLAIAVSFGYEVNEKALRGVLPPLIPAEDIVCQLGATWIDDKYIKEFVKDIFKTPIYKDFAINYDKNIGCWIIDKYFTYKDPEISNTWSVAKTDEKLVIGIDGKEYYISQPDIDGWDILDFAINSKTPSVYNYWSEYDTDNTEHKKRKLNIERTTEARMLVEQMQLTFSDWIFSDMERREVLVNKYNELFNSIRLEEFDGSYLTFPNMSSLYQLEQYQKNAVARIMTSSENTLLSQRVGAGKTFEMIAAGMEMIRLGLKNKLLYVVPNHLVEQWGKDFMKLYPNVNILIADKKDFQKSKRQLFVHKIATGNYDAIIIAHSSFSLIPVSDETLISSMEEEIYTLQTAIENINYGEESSLRKKQVKQLERTKKSIENNIKNLTDTKRDQGITFEQLGIDFMFVDEAHEFKNLYIYSARQNIAGIPNAKSKKASDMLLKTKWIKDNGGGICFATGTPISNTMAELYVLQKYLQNNTLEEMGIYCFDAWAKNFGEVVTSFEISIDGNSFKSRERFCKFFNVQELVTLFKNVAEIQTESMLKKELKNSTTGRKYAIPPDHIGGKPVVITIEPSNALINYMEKIVERAENVHTGSVNSHVDNMLKITSDSKKASIDLRLTEDGYDYTDSDNSKLNVIAQNIVKVYYEYNDDNATQLVFCDSSTPNKNKFNVYDELKRLLIEYSIPENEIAFIHDYESMQSKQMLFDKVNNGNVRIIFGSTAKLGAGTNIQKRLIALHHVDVPWRASDIEQRNGRAFRQGNMYKEIYEFRYVTKKSFDAYSWQMIETKASYQKQLFEGTSCAREMEEDNKAFFSYSEIKAIASDNPLVQKKFEVDNQIKKLETLQKQWQKKLFAAQNDRRKLPHDIDYLKNRIDLLSKDMLLIKNNPITLERISELFKVELNGRLYNDMKEAGEVILNTIRNNKKDKYIDIGKFCDFNIRLEYDINHGWIINLIGAKNYKVDIVHQVGRINFERMLRVINKIPITLNSCIEKLNNAYSNLQLADNIINSEFPNKKELVDLRKIQKEINNQLAGKMDDVSINNIEVDIEQTDLEI